MKFVYWLLALPLTLVAVSFAVSNTTSIEFGLWPLPATLSTPLYLAVFAVFLAGCLTGAILSWFGRSRSRRQARETRRKLTERDREAAELKAKLARLAPPEEDGTARSASVPATAGTRRGNRNGARTEIRADGENGAESGAGTAGRRAIPAPPASAPAAPPD